ncbi:MAG TPA: hypothetical protein VI790_04165 [Candidatus Nanoarchaeia archaeon]|nr:hypothetical protein [Candidatus Nanoarchaeia archaeon]
MSIIDTMRRLFLSLVLISLVTGCTGSDSAVLTPARELAGTWTDSWELAYTQKVYTKSNELKLVRQ